VGQGEGGREAWEVRVEDNRVRIGDVVAGMARFERWYVDVYIFIYIYISHVYICKLLNPRFSVRGI
jgi:hypothetical protein